MKEKDVVDYFVPVVTVNTEMLFLLFEKMSRMLPIASILFLVAAAPQPQN
jgi:hypothetical protein